MTIMLTEREYRALPYDSNSSTKDFIDDRKKYYKRWVLNEEIVEEPSKWLKNGSLVDTLYFSPKKFDDKFVLTSVQPPSGQMLKFVEALYRRSEEATDENGNLKRTMEVLTREAYNDVKFDRAGNVVAFKRKNDTLEGILEKFIDSDAELYYRQLMNARGKSVVELFEVQGAEKTVHEIKNNWVTRYIMTLTSGPDYEVYNQLAIIFEYLGHKMKALLDKLVVDHQAKQILIYDLKTCWDNEREFQANWYKYKYYIQAAVYYQAAKAWAIQEGWSDYEVIPMQFVVADSSNYQNPLIYLTDLVNLQQGLGGFTLNGRYHPGVNWAIENIKWHKETNIWEISKENYENKGIVKIKPFIEDDY